MVAFHAQSLFLADGCVVALDTMPCLLTRALSLTHFFRIIATALCQPVAPVAYQVILEPGIGQFREFEPRRAHTR